VSAEVAPDGVEGDGALRVETLLFIAVNIGGFVICTT
jgi:hypothetical protein